jgi:hypothetical protein
MKAIKILISSIILMGMSFSLLDAKEKRGAEIKIILKGNSAISGELIAVRGKSLLVAGTDLPIQIQDIQSVTIRKKSKFWLGLGIGLAAGIPVGRVVRNIAKEPSGWNILGTRDAQGVYALLACTLAGMIWGASAGADETITFEGGSTTDLEKGIKALRKRARIVNSE